MKQATHSHSTPTHARHRHNSPPWHLTHTHIHRPFHTNTDTPDTTTTCHSTTTEVVEARIGTDTTAGCGTATWTDSVKCRRTEPAGTTDTTDRRHGTLREANGGTSPENIENTAARETRCREHESVWGGRRGHHATFDGCPTAVACLIPESSWIPR